MPIFDLRIIDFKNADFLGKALCIAGILLSLLLLLPYFSFSGGETPSHAPAPLTYDAASAAPSRPRHAQPETKLVRSDAPAAVPTAVPTSQGLQEIEDLLR